MENPLFWTAATNVISQTITKFNDRPKDYIGLSEAKLIEEALLAAGFLTPASQKVVGLLRPKD